MSVVNPSSVSTGSFYSEAKGNLKDLYKDLNDMNDAINDDSSWRVMTNNVELAFNMLQLTLLDPPAAIAANWERQFGLLQNAVDNVSAAIDNDASMSQLKSRVSAAKKQTMVVYRMVR
jgi:hypothetical protein